jgi:hypothetical protein
MEFSALKTIYYTVFNQLDIKLSNILYNIPLCITDYSLLIQYVYVLPVCFKFYTKLALNIHPMLGKCHNVTRTLE